MNKSQPLSSIRLEIGKTYNWSEKHLVNYRFSNNEFRAYSAHVHGNYKDHQDVILVEHYNEHVTGNLTLYYKV